MTETPQEPPRDASPPSPPTPPPPYAAPPTAPPYAAAPYGAPPPVPPGMYYDQASGLTLPNGVVLASVGRRIGAYFLAIPLAIVTLVIGYVIWGAIVWGQGTTPALQVLGMKVWRTDTGQVPGWWTMALREIVGRIVEGILGAITGLVSFVLFLSGREHKSLHDMISNTTVVHDPSKVLST